MPTPYDDLDLAGLGLGPQDQVAALANALRGRQLAGILQVSGNKGLMAGAQGMERGAEADLGRQEHALKMVLGQRQGQQKLGLEERQLQATIAHQRALEAERRRATDQDAFGAVADPVYGGILTYSKKTGELVPKGGGPGEPTASGGPVGFKMTEPQAKAFSAVSRIREARRVMEEAGYPEGTIGRWDAAATGAGRGSSLVPQEAATEKGQQYFTAGRNLIAALLRKESGAAITKDEWQELGPLYIPMPWDSEQTRTNKLQMLDVMEKSAISEAGPAAGAHLASTAPKPKAPASPAGAGPVKVKTVEEARALPPGTRFITPDGKEKVR